MKKKFFFNLFFVMIFPFCYAQNYTIKQIDSLISYTEKAYTEKNDNNVIALSNRNYKISQKANYPEGMVKSLITISKYYWSRGNYEKTIQYAKQTEEEASNINDYKSICTGLRMAAISYYSLGLYEEAQEMLTKAFSIADKISDPDDFYESRGDLYSVKGDIAYYGHSNNRIPDYFKYVKNALTEFSKIKNSKTRNSSSGKAYSDLGLAYAEKKMFDSAYHYMNISLNLARIDKNYYNECVVLNGLVYTSFTQKNYQQTINYLETLIPLSKKTNQLVILKLAYQTMQESYHQLGSKEKEMEYLAKYTKLNDSLAQADKLLKNRSFQKIINEKEETFLNEKDKLYLLIAATCLLSVLLCYFGYKAFKKYKVEKEKIQHKENVIVEKESQLIELKQKVNNAFDEIVDLAKKDDSVFLTRFQEVYPDIIKKLLKINPQLQPSELKFCALLFLNFSSKDIATYTFVQHQSIQTRKSRIRKKLNIPPGEDIYLWMKHLND
ncbi:tetratricopeptide repeat protein [Chryseobacterium sp. 'Rf worker isolate 10']|uniref:tetratricopeptide repeat protein n=1 Tax=Chryseobacterium sp. 'Rf worker isolate 10' TaxID=2887348 RepID=UPI003D6E7D10